MEKGALTGSPRNAPITPPTLTVTPDQIQYINGQPFYVRVGPKLWLHFRASVVQVLGAILVACALLSAILNVVGIAIYNGWGFSAFFIGHGFVGLIFYILAGSFAISAAKKKTTCKIVSTLVLCIIAVIFGGIIQIVASATGVGLSTIEYTKENRPWMMCGVGMYDYPDYPEYPDNWNQTFSNQNQTFRVEPAVPLARLPDYDNYGGDDYYRDRDGRHYAAFIAIHALMLISGLVQFVVACWCSSICCATVCCCCCCKKPKTTSVNIPANTLNMNQATYAPGANHMMPMAAPLYAAEPPEYTVSGGTTKPEKGPQY